MMRKAAVCLVLSGMIGAAYAAGNSKGISPSPVSTVDDLQVCLDPAGGGGGALPACLHAAQETSRTSADRAAAYGQAGDMEVDNRKLDTALGYFDRALELDGNCAQAYSGRGTVEFMKGNYVRADADVKKAIALEPNAHPEAYLIAGTLANRAGNDNRTLGARIAYMNKAIALKPDYGAAYAGRGKAYLLERKFDLASADYGRAIELDPEYAQALRPVRLAAYIGRANSLARSRNFRAAIAAYSKALEIDPTNAAALNGRGDARNMIGEYRKAIVDLSAAIGYDPALPAPHTNRGLSYYRIGHYDQALVDLNKAIRLGDNGVPAYFLRGQIYKSKHDVKDAQADFNKALGLTPSDSPVRYSILSAMGSLDRQ